MRGKLYVAFLAHYKSRITPADAGKTAARQVRLPAGRDHPRGCGENIYCRIEGEDAAGSPPRMRGKHIIVEGVAK